MEGTPSGSQRNVDLAMRARHRGQQFLVTLKAIKAGMGLVSAPCKLVMGEPIVLQTAGHRAAVNTVQVFAAVGKEYEGRSLFVLSWEKAVSPTGMTALIEFLQTILGICLDGSTAMPNGLIDGEMAFFDFHSGRIQVPSRGTSTSAPADGLEEMVRHTQDDLRSGSRRTGPITRDGVTPAHAAPHPGSPRDQAAHFKASAPGSAFPPAAGGPGADDDMVDMFGVKVSRAAWEKLEDVRFSGSSPAADRARELSRPDPARDHARRETRSDEDSEREPGGKDGKPKGPSLLRRLASKLADKR